MEFLAAVLCIPASILSFFVLLGMCMAVVCLVIGLGSGNL